MIIDFEALKNQDFSLSGINIFYQKPSYRVLEQQSRQVNGFLFVLHGEGTYRFGEESFSISPGALIYLPIHSAHTFLIKSREMDFYRIDFKLTVNDEIALFSETPLKLCDTASPDLSEAIQTLADRYQFAQDTVAKTELLCTIFRSLSAMDTSPRKEKISPAIRYLLEHLTEGISCKTLAEVCALSTAQFYHLFHEEYGMAPLEYRDALLMRRATLLLKDGSFSVTEIAETLGFESVSYFSRFFKKHQGISPSAYIRQKPQKLMTDLS